MSWLYEHQHKRYDDFRGYLMNEADFVEKLQRFYENKNKLTLREVNFSYGRPDLVILDVDRDKFKLREKREQFSTLLNRKFFEVLSIMPDIDDRSATPIGLREISERSGISQSYVRSSILSELKSGGFVKQIDGGYVKVNGWVPIAKTVTAIEAKLSDWKRGIWQANRYSNVADKVYLAMPPEYIHRVDIDECKRKGVGLISFDPLTSKHKVLVKPSKQVPQDRPVRNYVTELFLDEHALLRG
ncbi:MAG TPA: hypothetical protein PLZ58_00820 [Candidatus Saccharibacteria bacterium]|nr:hypothetical protein [Candidatus Saccharibacteria bacterium]HRQ07136.1 hypothetical protein [Candidatus Saccharibacteria bacterium]